MVTVRTAPGLVEGLVDLADALESLDLEVVSGVEPGSSQLRDHLARTIRSFLLPRLENPDAPFCVVVAGPTGSGKSTLVNSLSGVEVSETGAIRPTTKDPVVLASPHSGEDYSLLAGVACQVIEDDSVELGQMTLVDTPDIDSTEVEHRESAECLIDSADVVILVTSAMRYADEVPWEILRRTWRRGTPVAHVLNRVTPEATGALVDLKARLRASGVGGEVFRVPEYHLVRGQQSLPPGSVRRLASWLEARAGDVSTRRRTLHAAMEATVAGSRDLAEMIDRVSAWVGDLEKELSDEFTDAVERLDLAGLGVTEGIDAPPVRARRQRRWLRKNRLDEPATARRLGDVGRRLTAAIEDDLGSLTLRPGDLSVQVQDVGRPLRPEALRRGIEAAIKGWFDYVRRMTELQDTSYQGLGAVALVECALDGHATALARALFGDSVDTLVGRGRRELNKRLESLYEAAARRTISQIAHLAVDSESARSLRRAAERVSRLSQADA
ncbi:MAG: GTPase [Acidimicrobiia bacterium]|nr:GTPase [Acidimicrobiia bacterium]